MSVKPQLLLMCNVFESIFLIGFRVLLKADEINAQKVHFSKGIGLSQDSCIAVSFMWLSHVIQLTH